jgi:hypothetical protein
MSILFIRSERNESKDLRLGLSGEWVGNHEPLGAHI